MISVMDSKGRLIEADSLHEIRKEIARRNGVDIYCVSIIRGDQEKSGKLFIVVDQHPFPRYDVQQAHTSSWF